MSLKKIIKENLALKTPEWIDDLMDDLQSRHGSAELTNMNDYHYEITVGGDKELYVYDSIKNMKKQLAASNVKFDNNATEQKIIDLTADQLFLGSYLKNISDDYGIYIFL